MREGHAPHAPVQNVRVSPSSGSAAQIRVTAAPNLIIDEGESTFVGLSNVSDVAVQVTEAVTPAGVQQAIPTAGVQQATTATGVQQATADAGVQQAMADVEVQHETSIAAPVNPQPELILRNRHFLAAKTAQARNKEQGVSIDQGTDQAVPYDPSSLVSAAVKPRLSPRFTPVEIPPRQYGMVDGTPIVHFTTAEFDVGAALFRHSLIAKFTIGRPPILQIREVFKAHWLIKGRATVSDIWDGRHVMIILDSEDDARIAFTSPLRKVGHAMFRLFRYTPDYNPRRESTMTTKWVRLPGLHPAFITKNYVSGIVNTFGFFLDIDERTKACASLKYARACVEVDVTKPIPKEVQIMLSDGRKFRQPIEVEGNMAYYSYCRIHGHTLAECRKKKPSAGHKVGTDDSNNLKQNSHATQTTQIDKETTVVIYEELSTAAQSEHPLALSTKEPTPLQSQQSTEDKSSSLTNTQKSSPAENTNTDWVAVKKRKGKKKPKTQTVELNQKSDLIGVACPNIDTCLNITDPIPLPALAITPHGAQHAPENILSEEGALHFASVNTRKYRPRKVSFSETVSVHVFRGSARSCTKEKDPNFVWS